MSFSLSRLVFIIFTAFFGLTSCSEDNQVPDDQKKPEKKTSIKPIVIDISPTSGRPGDIITINGRNLSGEVKAQVSLVSGYYPTLEPEIVSQDSVAIRFKIPADPIGSPQTVFVKRGDSTANWAPTLVVRSKYWKSTQNTSSNRIGGGSTFMTFAINDIGYFLGRALGFKSYNPATNTVTTLTWPSPNQRLATFAIGNKGYALATPSLNTNMEVWEFDPAITKWSKKTATIQKMPFFCGFTFVINGKAYIGGGSDKVFVSYDPVTDQFAKLADYPGVNGDGAGAIAVDGIAYVFGGGSSLERYVSNIYPTQSNPSKNWKYDPITNEWSQLATGPGLNSDRSFAVIMSDAGLIYFGLGYSDLDILYNEDHAMYTYSISTNSWTLHSFGPMVKSPMFGFNVGNTAYYADTGGSFWHNFNPSGF